jgi:hypothetical protein
MKIFLSSHQNDISPFSLPKFPGDVFRRDGGMKTVEPLNADMKPGF